MQASFNFELTLCPERNNYLIVNKTSCCLMWTTIPSTTLLLKKQIHMIAHVVAIAFLKNCDCATTTRSTVRLMKKQFVKP